MGMGRGAWLPLSASLGAGGVMQFDREDDD